MSDVMELDYPQSRKSPRTTTVLVFLAASAMILAWLVVYGLTNALTAADLMAGFSREADPRPQWMIDAQGRPPVLLSFTRWPSASQPCSGRTASP